MGITYMELPLVKFCPLTTAERDALDNIPDGLTIHNTTTEQLEIYLNMEWHGIHDTYGAIVVGNDPNFYLGLTAGYRPILSLDALDSIQYDRPANELYFIIGNSILAYVEPNSFCLYQVPLRFRDISTPANPPSASGYLYSKDTGGLSRPYWLNSAGTESILAFTSELHTILTIGADAEHSLAGQVLSGVDASSSQKGHVAYGTSATTACAGNDARLSDARTPTAHGPSKHTEGTAWRLCYYNASGDETEIALGADGTVLTSAGVAAAPAFEAAGGGTVAVYEAGVQVVAAASVLDFNAGFDIVDAGSGHADISLDLTEATWTFAQGGFYFRDASGPLLYTGASGDDLFLTGDLDVSGHMALGATAVLSTLNVLTLKETLAGETMQHGIRLDLTGDGAIFIIGGRFTVTGAGTGGGQIARGISGSAMIKDSGGAGIAEGLIFQAIADAGAATVARLSCISVDPQDTAAQAGALTLAEGIRIGAGASWPGVKPATVKGVYIAAALSVAGVTTAYGLHIEDLAGTTVRLLEIGPATPYLRLVGGAAPAANQTNLYLAEGVTPTLRRVQWKNPDATGHLAATDKVLVLV
jgi:hypothetical protein